MAFQRITGFIVQDGSLTASTHGSTVSGGVATLAAPVDYLRVVSSNGSDIFDAGPKNLFC